MYRRQKRSDDGLEASVTALAGRNAECLAALGFPARLLSAIPSEVAMPKSLRCTGAMMEQSSQPPRRTSLGRPSHLSRDSVEGEVSYVVTGSGSGLASGLIAQNAEPMPQRAGRPRKYRGAPQKPAVRE